MNPNTSLLAEKLKFKKEFTSFLNKLTDINKTTIYNKIANFIKALDENKLNELFEILINFIKISSNNIYIDVLYLFPENYIDFHINNYCFSYINNKEWFPSNEYIIINVFKSVLNRSPNSSEIIRYSEQMENNELDEHLLKIQLMNSTEYRRNVKLQSNDVEADLEYAYAKEDLLTYISKLYFDERNMELPHVMLLPLRDIYVYLQK